MNLLIMEDEIRLRNLKIHSRRDEDIHELRGSTKPFAFVIIRTAKRRERT